MTISKKQKGDIGLSDLITALKELDIRDPKHESFAYRALGFYKSQNQIRPQDNKIYDPYRYSNKSKEQSRDYSKNKSFSAPPIPKLPVSLPKDIVDAELTPIESSTVIPDSANIPDYISEPEEFPQGNLPKLTRYNLLPKTTHRGILSAALSTIKCTTVPDIPKLIKQVVQKPFVHVIPFKTSTTLQQGCQLLLNYSDNMIPYWEDLHSLANQVENLVGQERITIYEFDQKPAEAEHWISNTSKPSTWRLKESTPVLIATDFDIAGRVNTPVKSCWIDFIEECKQYDIPLIILIPWQEKYWPKNLGNYPYLVHWNPHTSAAMLQQKIGKGHKVTP